MKVSVLEFGGAEIGLQDATIETVEALLGAALDAGLNIIDTAECYKADGQKNALKAAPDAPARNPLRHSRRGLGVLIHFSQA